MLATAVLLGLFGSLHCLGMCGPIAFMLPVDRGNSLRLWLQVAGYHGGRIIAYAGMGLLFGILGRGLYLFGLQQRLSIVIGVLMILIVLVPALGRLGNPIMRPFIKITNKLRARLGKGLAQKNADTFLSLGFLNGLLPCGLVYMAILASLAMADAWQGALYMSVFGLGTVPLMTAAIYLGKFLDNKFRVRIRKVIPIFVFLIGVLFVIRGLGLGIPYLSPEPVHAETTATIECHPNE